MTQWVAALRSGDYKQGAGQLRSSDNHFCCLGVLCNLHAMAHPVVAEKERDVVTYNGQMGLLPSTVEEWAGMKSSDGTLYDADGDLTDLASINDDGSSFIEIADIIEDNYKEL